ncbi:RNA polymerase sigma factor [Glycomyces rhizosphaerae]|uniref:RNA polymerase sigma factor n=1 Tax=Glycomyces rhizosphaerae TaxID=2054422 RepID=A0ABV7PX13_9ACTN
MNELLDALAPFVGRICGPIALGHGADASQEALIAIFKSLKTLRAPEAVWGWARTIAVREAVRVARDRRTVPAELADLPQRGDPQLETEIGDVLRRLSPEHRAVLVLRDLEGYSESEAAALLAIEVGTVKSRLHRARRTFREVWSE